MATAKSVTVQLPPNNVLSYANILQCNPAVNTSRIVWLKFKVSNVHELIYMHTSGQTSPRSYLIHLFGERFLLWTGRIPIKYKRTAVQNFSE